MTFKTFVIFVGVSFLAGWVLNGITGDPNLAGVGGVMVGLAAGYRWGD